MVGCAIVMWLSELSHADHPVLLHPLSGCAQYVELIPVPFVYENVSTCPPEIAAVATDLDAAAEKTAEPT